MLTLSGIAGVRSGLRAGEEFKTRGRRPRRRRAWAVETLEGRALLSIYLVDSPGDTGAGLGPVGDLRYAIEQADQETGNSTIVFAPNLYGQTITLSSGMLEIAKRAGTLTIQGPGARALTISGGGQGPVLAIDPISKVAMSGLTVTGGVGSQGGGISNDGQLTLSLVTITGNTALGGGGGGIANGPFGTLTLTASTVAGNVSDLADGGGIANAGTLTVNRSTISGNAVTFGNGGGIANSGTLTIEDSTLSGNSAVYGSGGGISNTSALSMLDDTVSGNTADVSGGGLDNEALQGGTVAMDNTIVAGNTCTQDARTADVIDDADFDGSHLVGGSDLIGSGDLGTLSRTLAGVAPKLGPLQDNGGPTWTQAPLAGSPALNAGDPSLVPDSMTTDQRGYGHPRIVHGQVDIGAFEHRAPQPPLLVLPRVLPPVASLPGDFIGLTIIPSTASKGRAPSTTGAAGSIAGGPLGES